MVKHYHYDCISITERSRLYEIEQTTCKYCLERLWKYKINTSTGTRDTTKAKAYFQKKDNTDKKRKELKELKKGLI
jgi:hypothetical protein